ncbi:DNA-binding response regulator, OmpR family, contains REC and winged-helix (wHTH) domain [Lachnospiraceae bacterium XBB1006]|nr:DNA-binding response regulator, OmpR family, contains REC and winged-helix (wHTH) domain [Lachnospiraceae bacterium XBB1006]
MYKLFLVEDDSGIAEAIATQAAMWNYELYRAENYQDIMAEFSKEAPQLVLLDITLPFFNGYHWCTQIRKVSQVPILFISSAGDNMNIVMAMNMGADDFLVKPFDFSVMMAKIQALLRRSYDFAGSLPVMEHNGVMLHTGEQVVLYGEERLELSKNEYRILLCLMENRGQVVSREKLMQRLWETDCFVDENTLSVNVNRLRKKLEGIGVKNFIATKFGEGYQI